MHYIKPYIPSIKSVYSMNKRGIVLTVVIIILAVSNVFVYTALDNQITTLTTNYEDGVSSHSHSNVEYDAYVANHHYTDTEFSSAS